MQIDVVNLEGKKVGKIELADEVFGAEVNEHLLYEVVKAQQAAARAGTHTTKTRDEVRGGGKKPYKQKGTGNARQGSSRAPHYVGGGKVFGPQPRDYSLPCRRRCARPRCARRCRCAPRRRSWSIVDEFALDEPKTKRLAGVLKALGADTALVVDGKDNVNLSKSARNLPTPSTCRPRASTSTTSSTTRAS